MYVEGLHRDQAAQFILNWDFWTPKPVLLIIALHILPAR